MKKVEITIRTITRRPPPKNSLAGSLGPVCINEDITLDAATGKKIDKSLYINQSTLRNMLLERDKPAYLPCDKLIGSTITYNEFEVTQKMLDESKLTKDVRIFKDGKTYIEKAKAVMALSNGKEITWTTVGVKPINFKFGHIADYDFGEKEIHEFTYAAMVRQQADDRIENRRRQRAQEQAQASEETANAVPEPPTDDVEKIVKPTENAGNGPAGTENAAVEGVIDPALVDEGEEVGG